MSIFCPNKIIKKSRECIHILNPIISIYFYGELNMAEIKRLIGYGISGDVHSIGGVLFIWDKYI